jgi:hypothetical protein
MFAHGSMPNPYGQAPGYTHATVMLAGPAEEIAAALDRAGLGRFVAQANLVVAVARGGGVRGTETRTLAAIRKGDTSGALADVAYVERRLAPDALARLRRQIEMLGELSRHCEVPLDDLF